MPLSRRLICGLILVCAGCQQATPPAPPAGSTAEVAVEEMHAEKIDPAVVRAEMAKLDEADRSKAMAQGYCVVSREPLGSMGVPVKVSLDDGRSVFICCKGCEELVRSKPDEMFARLPELEERTKKEKPAGDEPAAPAAPSEPEAPAAEAPAEPATPAATPQ